MIDDLERIKSVANATEAVAKSTEKAIDGLEKIGTYFSRFIDGAVSERVGIIEDRLKFTRWERQVRYIQKIEEISNGREYLIDRTVPLKIALPIFSNASVEEDDYLQDKWAEMLLNASCSHGAIVTRSYINILEELSIIDVKALTNLYALDVIDIESDLILTHMLNESAYIEDDKKREIINPSEEVVLSLQNLSRLGLVRPIFTASAYYRYDGVYQTLLGRAFVNSCTYTCK